MSAQRTVVTSGGIRLGGLLFVAFLVLKLTGVIAWSWWWVTAPLWGPFMLVVGVLPLVGLALLIRKRRSS